MCIYVCLLLVDLATAVYSLLYAIHSYLLATHAGLQPVAVGSPAAD